MINRMLGSRASIGGVLGSGRGGAAAWYLAGGVSAANCVAAYQPKGAASLAASYTNLANPGTYNAAPGTAPTWNAATGWSFTSTSSQYLTTGVIPATDQQWSLIVRFDNTPTTAEIRCPIGVQWESTGVFDVLTSLSASDEHVYENGGASLVANRLSSGVMCVAGNQGYLNGAADGGTIAAITGTNTHGIYIGARNRYGALRYHFSGNIIAVAIYDATLSAPQVAAISAAMAAL